MAATADPSTIEHEVHVDAPPEVVFPYFTDPELLCRWQGTEATLEAHAGGAYRVVIVAGNVARGEFVEVDAPHRVVFTWGWEGEGHSLPPGSTRVEVDLRPEGAGTIVRLRHSGLEGVWAERHAEGWDRVLPRLAIAATGGDPDQVAPNPEQSGAEERDNVTSEHQTRSKKMGQPVLHFEVAGKDGPALQKYYDELFGWKTSTHEASGYGMVDTQAGDKGIGGGIMTNPMGHQMVTFYVGVDDLGDSLKKAEKLGGKTVLEPTKIPDGPDIALFSDPEGNVVGLVTGM